MPLLGLLIVVIQFSFAFHALKTGRPYWWLFVIMGFPVMGCLIYYFVEVFPGSKEERKAHKTARSLIRKLQPDADLKKRVADLETCGSVDNKMALAEECLNHQMYEEAVTLYESCLKGAFADDGALLVRLAGAATEAGQWDKAQAVLECLAAVAPKHVSPETQLLHARIAQGRGQNDAALSAYRELIPEFVGLEARVRYGQLLDQLGQQEAALQMFNEVLAHSKRFASSIDSEHQWAEAARQGTKGRPQGA